MEAARYERIYKALLSEIDSCRSQILDLVELECGDSPRWNFLRSRLLRCLGDGGLQGKLLMALEAEIHHTT